MFEFFPAALQGLPNLKQLSFLKCFRKQKAAKNLMGTSAPSLIFICSAITLLELKEREQEVVCSEMTPAG